jgi:hypothetical protein
MATVSPYTAVPSDKVSGNPIKASEWNQLAINQASLKTAVEGIGGAAFASEDSFSGLAAYTVDVTIAATGTYVISFGGTLKQLLGAVPAYSHRCFNGGAVVVNGAIIGQQAALQSVDESGGFDGVAVSAITSALSSPTTTTVRLTIPQTQSLNNEGSAWISAAKLG